MSTLLAVVNCLLGVVIGYHLASAKYHDRMARGWGLLADVARDRPIVGQDVIDAFGSEVKR